MAGGNLGGFNYDAGDSGSYIDSNGQPHLVITHGAERPKPGGGGAGIGRDGASSSMVGSTNVTPEKGSLLIDSPNHGYGYTSCDWTHIPPTGPQPDTVIYNIHFPSNAEAQCRIFNNDLSTVSVRWVHAGASTAAGLKNLESQAQDIVRDVADFRSDLGVVFNVLNQMSDRFGQKLEEESKRLAQLAYGKQLRSVDEAIAAFGPYQAAIISKYGNAELQSIANAIESMDKAQMAVQLKAWGRYFGYAGDALDAYAVTTGIVKGLRTNDWSDAISAMESFVGGKIVGLAVAVAFSSLAVSGVGIVGYALLYGLAAATFNTDTLNEMQNFFMSF